MADTPPKTEHIAAGALPPWTVGELPPAPARGWRRWAGVVGPGVLLAGASIGSGEWLTGPGVTAQYGCTLLWLATLSIAAQVFINLSMIRYTLYCGEPIVVGFFRSRPGPRLWTFCYAALDFASIWPFNVAGAAVVLAAALLGHLPGNASCHIFGWTFPESSLPMYLSFVLFLLAFVPLIFGGTIYRMLIRIFTFKLVVVLVYLAFFAVVTVSAANAWDVFTGFFRFGQVPVRAETVIADRHFTLTEDDGPVRYTIKGTFEKDREVVTEFTVKDTGPLRKYTVKDKVPSDLQDKWESLLARARVLTRQDRFFVADVQDGVRVEIEGAIRPDRTWKEERVFVADVGGARPYVYEKLEDVPEPAAGRARQLLTRQGVQEVNLVDYWREHGRPPQLDWALVGVLAAIAGAGGLANTLYSSFARDKGWGMGARVGAIPSLVGGRAITLSHVGEAFRPNAVNRPRWRGWVRYIVEDQLVVWMVCNFLGMALPCMLSLEFIRHAPISGDRVAAQVAEGMAHRFPDLGGLLWYLTLLVGFLVLYPGQILSGDILARRWTDIIWASNPQAQRLEGNQVKYVYYGIMLLYAIWGMIALALFNMLVILKIGGVLMNVAMSFSAFHTLYVTYTLMPRELRPNWFMQIGTLFCGLFFLGITVIVVLTF